MPAKSQNQQEAMGIAHAIQEGKVAPKPGTPSADIAKTMKPADVKEFASTPRAGLPKQAAPKAPPKPQAPPKQTAPGVKVVSKTIKKIPLG